MLIFVQQVPSVAPYIACARCLIPVLFHGKRLIKALWLSKVSWDESLLTDLQLQWQHVASSFQQLSTITIPRRILYMHQDATYQLITFCDALEQMYATAMYLRAVADGRAESNLVFSKMRLAPSPKSGSTKITIPRLELLAVLLGVRATKFTADQLKLPIQRSLLFSDSACVLYWLQTNKFLP